VRLLRNLVARPLDPNDGQRWYRGIDWLMRLPEEMDRQVHQQVQATLPEGTMSYISFAERQGIEKGIEQGERAGLLRGLRALLEARFGPEGAALVDRLGEQPEPGRIESLTRVASTVRTLDELRPHFNGKPAP
jgi:hypothetical protein